MPRESIFNDNAREKTNADSQFAHPTIQGALPLAEKLIQENAIDPNMFADLYGRENVERDLKKVSEFEKKFFADPAHKTAKVLEAIMLAGELHNWFGNNTEVIKSSRFDDIINGTDLILELEEIMPRRFSQVSIAVDVTFGLRQQEKKFERIKDEIDRGKLATIKYFHSEKEHFRGERSNIPRVVIGIEYNRVVELAALWLRKDNVTLATHPVQRVILEEVALQLERFKTYASKTGKTHLAPLFERDLAIIQSILKEKKNIPLGEYEYDRVLQDIKTHTTTMF